MAGKPKVLVAIPPGLYRELFAGEADARLTAVADLSFNGEERNWNSAELAQRIGGFDAVITGWGTPVFTEEVMAAAQPLRLIAHSAGSIKAMLPAAVFGRGIAVTHVAVAMAPAVAEMTILLIMLCLRQVHRYDRMLKAGATWSTTKALGLGEELAGQRVGVVGAGYTGRKVIGLLRGLGAEVWVYDPYLTAARAAEMGVRLADLDELFAGCPIVTMQAPPTDETYRMVGAAQLGLLCDGAIFVNTARSHTVDQDALLAELQRGRIQAALDVYDQEPLPADSPFLRLENVVLTPHIAAATVQTRRRQGTTTVDEIERFFERGELRYQVTAEMLVTMA